MPEPSGWHVLVPAARTGPLCPVSFVHLQRWTRHASRRIPSHIVIVRLRRVAFDDNAIQGQQRSRQLRRDVDPPNVTEPHCGISTGGIRGFNNAQAKTTVCVPRRTKSK